MTGQPFQVMPPLDDEQHHALRQSIEANGVLQPVEVDENGVILDGHHRVAIATELGIDYPTRVVEGLADDAAKRRYATTINVARRQLTPAQRSGYVAQLRMQGLSIRAIAEATGVSRGTVANDLAQLSNSGQLTQPERITGADNKSRPATRPQTPASTPEPAPATDVDMPARATNSPLSRAGEPADAQPAADPTTPGADGQADTVFRGTAEAGEQDGPAALPSPPARPEPNPEDQWTDEERDLAKRLRAGETVVVSMRSHGNLIAWADGAGLYERVDRRTAWGNPFEMPADGDRGTVVAHYQWHYLPHKPSLLAKLPTLKGKALGCWCAPAECHADVLAEAAEGGELR